MKLPRRQFLRLAAGVVVLPAVSRAARPDAYPAKPVRLINGFAAGGTADIFARLMGQWLSERLGQIFLTENRTGAASNIATEAVIRAPADGYTLLLVTPANAINATLYEKLNYDFIRDTAPVGGIMAVANVVEVHASLPVNTVPEFIAYAKANPGKINMASGGAGTTPDIFGELFKVKTGISLTHVPYRGTPPALNDLLGGQVQVIFDPIPSSIEHNQGGTTARACGDHCDEV
jgi:tripartite-type tricarboxylate transporter receptor subunit TctC